MRKILGYNFKTLLGFEAIYKLISAIIFTPLFLGIFQIITKVSGYSYLTLENVFSFLLHPLTIIFLFLLFLLLTFYTLIDISTIIIILDSSYQERKISIKNAFLMACQKSMKVFKKQNIGLPFLIIFLIPFLNIGLSSGFISTIKIPEFILEFIINNKLLAVIYIIVMVALTIMLFRWLYVLNYFVIEDLNFKEARKKSNNLSHKNKLKDFCRIIIGQIIILIIYMFFIFINILIIMGLAKIFAHFKILESLTISIIWLLIAISLIVLVLLATPINYALITVLFFKHKEKQKEKVVHLKVKDMNAKHINKKINILKGTLVILIISSATLFTYNILKGKYDLKIEYVHTMDVTAHRGLSVEYPENTMLAFIGAKEVNADWIELDVQQTLDNVLVVMHDSNLKRTTGVDKNTWETTYEEIKDLDAGSFLSESFKDARIPTLEEVIIYAKENNMKLNIELKPTGKEKLFEKNVLNLITKYDFVSNCVVTSQVYEVLENVKKINKDVKTVYVMSLAYGDITSLQDADSFSIEASSINKSLVKKIHNAGKEVYGWTVNNKDSINKMIEYNVDNIITDNVILAKKTIYESKTSNVIQEYIKLVNKIFK